LGAVLQSGRLLVSVTGPDYNPAQLDMLPSSRSERAWKAEYIGLVRVCSRHRWFESLPGFSM